MSKHKEELYKFIIVGLGAVATDFVVYFILKQFIDYSIAKGVSFIAGALLAYVLNKNWTFDANLGKVHGLGKFSFLYFTSFSFNVLTNKMVLTFFLEYTLIAFLFATGVSTLINYFGQKFWVFSKKGVSL